MKSEWKEAELGKLANFIDYRGKTPPKQSFGIPLITAKIIKENVIQPPQEFIDEDFYHAWMTRGIPNKDDIVFTTEAPIGEVAQIKTSKRLAFAQRVIILQAYKDIVDNNFLFYNLQYKPTKSQIEARSSGTTVFGIKSSELKKVAIKYPVISEQRAIAATLSCIDEKIALNNKINANLEAQAQAIFKNCFVDFEPFRDGEFVDSELGMIPKGWRVTSLINIAQYINGLAMQKFRPVEGEYGIPVLKIKELREGKFDTSSELCSESIETDYIVNDGDIIFSWSGSLLVDIWCGGLCGLNQHLFKVVSKNYDKWFYYFWTKHYLSEFSAIAASKATTMGHIKRNDLEKSLVLIPDEQVYKEVTTLISPIFEQIITNRIQSRTIAAIRDALLPKLMSGEINVPIE